MPLDNDAPVDESRTKDLTDNEHRNDATSDETHHNDSSANAHLNSSSGEQTTDDDSHKVETSEPHLTEEQEQAAPQPPGLKQVIDALYAEQSPKDLTSWYAIFPPSMQGAAKSASPLYEYLDRNDSGGYDPNPVPIDQSIGILNLGKYAAGLDALMLGLSSRHLSNREVVEQVLSHLSKIKQQYSAVQLYLAAGFPIGLASERFDPNLCSADEEQVIELQTCRWLAKGLSIVMIGEPGRGKTLFAIHLGKTAVSLGYSTIFLNATDFFIKLKRHQDRYGDVIKGELFKCKLLIIDDIGHDLSSDMDVSNLFYRLVDYRDANGRSTIFTSNQMPEKWVGSIQGQTETRRASLDRILHSTVMVFHQGTGSLRINKFKQLNPKLNVINE